MTYKKELINRIADMLQARPLTKSERLKTVKKKRIPHFALIDCTKQKHFGVLIHENNVPYFKRKAGMYGMTYADGFLRKVGLIQNTLAVLDVHIVEGKDLST